MTKRFARGSGFAFAGAVALLAALPSFAFADVAVAVTADGKLVSFDTASPSTLLTSVAVTGLQPAETLLGIDVRPYDGGLYALGSTSRLYRIDRATGAATVVGSGPFTPAVGGTAFGFDFNPVSDRIRVVSDTNQNLRLDPFNGTVVDGDVVTAGTQTDPNLAFAPLDPNLGADPSEVAVAYDRSVPGASATTLFGIDSALDVLVRQGGVDGLPDSPNGGLLHTVGALGVDTTDKADLEISGTTAFAVMQLQGAATSSLYTVNLTTGAATLVGTVGGGSPIRGFSIVTQRFVAVTNDDTIVTFAANAPGYTTLSVPITGLSPLEFVQAVDVRPSNGKVYLLGSTARLYTVDIQTGVATQVGTQFDVGLVGSDYGADFNPVADRLRVVGDVDQNFRVNADTGVIVDTDAVTAGTQLDTSLTFATGDAHASADPNVVAVAYDNNKAGAASTTLYGIDSNLDILVRQGSVGGNPTSPNAGTLTTIGSLGFDTNGFASLDIPAGSTTGYATMTNQADSQSRLFTVNLSTGAATQVGTIAAGTTIHGFSSLPLVVGPAAVTPIPAIALYALTSANALVSFQSDSPATTTAPVQITGLAAGENVVAIDVRPSSGVLYGITSHSNLVAVNRTTGAASVVGSGHFTPSLNGADFGFDFDPVTDRARVVSDADQNLRLDPSAGTATADTNLSFGVGDPNASANASVVALAYDRSTNPPTLTTAYGIDSDLDVLVRLGSPDGTPVSPNDGKVTTIGSLGVDTTAVAGFEILQPGNVAFAALTVGGVSRLYLVDLVSGNATLAGDIGSGLSIRGVAAAPTADPAENPPAPLTVTSFALKMNFKSDGKDSVTVKGKVAPITAPVAGKVVIVNVGGFQESFTLDSHGKGKFGHDKFAVATKVKNGVVVFSVSIKKQDLSDELADENITGTANVSKQDRTIVVSLTFDGEVHMMSVPVTFSAKAGKNGSAKLTK